MIDWKIFGNEPSQIALLACRSPFRPSAETACYLSSLLDVARRCVRDWSPLRPRSGVGRRYEAWVTSGYTTSPEPRTSCPTTKIAQLGGASS
jgi:hypothetical protein